ncbi:hypothetical protein O3Q51_11835 [Cryomorphaceae bacterium 1068]|nr:hypothetical protein [Cryomorphaceae bacterium 1068]
MSKEDGNSAEIVFAGMSEIEMAFYAKYKLPQHSREMKKELLLYLASKGLDKEKIETLTSSQLFKKTHPLGTCVRCGSYKVYMHNSDSAKKKIHCLICGFIEGSKGQGFRLLDVLFGR